MGCPLSVILADLGMVRTENEVVKPMNPPFCKRFVDHIYIRRSKITSFLHIKNVLMHANAHNVRECH